MNLSASDMISILTTIISLFLGGGWLSSYLAAKKKHKRGFLMPLQMLLGQNKVIFDELTREVGLDALEYLPDHLQNKFKALSYDNPPQAHLEVSN